MDGPLIVLWQWIFKNVCSAKSCRWTISTYNNHIKLHNCAFLKIPRSSDQPHAFLFFNWNSPKHKNTWTKTKAHISYTSISRDRNISFSKFTNSNLIFKSIALIHFYESNFHTSHFIVFKYANFCIYKELYLHTTYSTHFKVYQFSCLMFYPINFLFNSVNCFVVVVFCKFHLSQKHIKIWRQQIMWKIKELYRKWKIPIHVLV